MDPLMIELFRRLPPAETLWPVEEQALWLRAAIAVADLVYGPTERPIVVEVAQDAGLREAST